MGEDEAGGAAQDAGQLSYEFHGYVFTSRRETPPEYRRRVSSPRVFRVTAGFAEQDERLGSSASVEVRRDTAPGPAEAEALVWPAVWAETVRRLGEGDWRPSLNWLDVVELLAGQEAAPVSPPESDAGLPGPPSGHRPDNSKKRGARPDEAAGERTGRSHAPVRLDDPDFPRPGRRG